MALSPEDLLLIENTLSKTLAPMQRLVEKHEYALFGLKGASGDNGLEGAIKSVESLRKFRWHIVGLISGIQIGLAAALYFILR